MPRRVLALIQALVEVEIADLNAVFMEHDALRQGLAEDARLLKESEGLLAIAESLLEQRMLG